MTEQTIYTARTPAQLAEIGAKLTKLPIPRDGVDIFARRHKVKRTNAQNDRLWALHNLAAAHMNRVWPERAAAIVVMLDRNGIQLSKLERTAMLERVWDADDMHKEFKKRYLAGKSSTKPSKLEMMDKLTEYEADLVNEHGLVLGDGG